MRPEVRRLCELLDKWETMLRRAPAAGFDTSEALDDIAVLRRLLGLDSAGGAVTALAISTAWRLHRNTGKIKEPDPQSRGGNTRAGQYQVRDIRWWQTAQRECPTLLAKSDRAAARWLYEHRFEELLAIEARWLGQMFAVGR
jgi:hypothetical protein